MRKLLTPCILGTALALSACGNPDQAAEEGAVTALPDDETTQADTMSTFEGAGDTTSAAGAGATTGAMDGGMAGDDGLPADAARGGPEDAMNSAEVGGAAGDGGPPGGPQS